MGDPTLLHEESHTGLTTQHTGELSF